MLQLRLTPRAPPPTVDEDAWHRAPARQLEQVILHRTTVAARQERGGGGGE